MEYNDKQVQIMEAAEKLFSEKGFAGTSVRDIAESAHVNLAMISYYFGSKEKLLEAVFTFRSHYLTLQLENMIQNKELTSMQKFNMMIDHYIERIMKNQCFHRILTREQMTNPGGTTYQLITQLKLKNQALVKQLISEGQKSGEFKKNIDIPLMMMTLVGTTSQLITTQQFYKEMNNLQDLSEEEFQKQMKKKLSNHLKALFKAILVYEE